jgi:hypothetical protein
VVCTAKARNAYKLKVREPYEKRDHLGNQGVNGRIILILIFLRKYKYEDMEWIQVTQNMIHW